MTNLKPFCLEAALRGEPVITRKGRKILVFAYCDKANDDEEIIVCICNKPDRAIWKYYYDDGSYLGNKESEYDLFMAPSTKKLWIAICKIESTRLLVPFNYHFVQCAVAEENKHELEKLIAKDEYPENWIIKEIEIEV